MPPDPHSSAAQLHDPGSLLEHVGWVRELAQRLVRDSHVADDLTQETMLAAIENRGTEARSPRAWLSRVLRNVMWERVRQSHRRQAREQAVARQDAVASSAEIVEKVDTHRTLVDAVLRLPEHYRIVLLRRYFEGETPTQIAAALDMPISTVKTRLQRGIERMRAELDEAYGHRDRWQPALLGLIGMPRRSALLPLPIAVAATLLLTGIVAVAWSAWADPAAAPAPPSTEAIGAVTTNAQTQPETDEMQRTPVPSQNAIAVDWGSIKMPKQPVRGITVSPDGRPVGGVFLQFEPDRPSKSGGTVVAISQADGTFEMALRRSGRIVATAGELATVSPAVVNVTSKEELRVVVTQARALSGTVRDEHGNALAHADVLIAEPPAMRGLLGANASTAEVSLLAMTTDATGTFAFEAAPLSTGSLVLVRREGFVEQVLTWSGQKQLDVTMQAPPPSSHEVHGVVYSPRGLPVADARVSCGTSVTRSNRDGAFRLALPRLPQGMDEATLVATTPGMCAATVVSTGLDAERRPRWPDGLDLYLGPAPLTVTGTVRRADGRPAAGARVWLADPTLFHHREGGSMTTSIFSSKKSASRKFWPETLESLQSTTGELEAVQTDTDGRFTIDGLCDRPYTLMAYDCATSLRSRPVVAKAGTEDVEIRLARDVIEKVQGVVVDEHNKPIAGVSVSLWSDLIRLQWGNEDVFSQNHVRGAMRTGPDGSFWLYDVPTAGVMLYFDGAGIVPRTHEVVDRPLRIVAQHASPMSITCADHAAVDSVGALDGVGKPVMLQFRRGNSTLRQPRAKMLMGRAETFALPDQAVVVVGYKDDEEVRRTLVQPNMRTVTW